MDGGNSNDINLVGYAWEPQAVMNLRDGDSNIPAPGSRSQLESPILRHDKPAFAAAFAPDHRNQNAEYPVRGPPVHSHHSPSALRAISAVDYVKEFLQGPVYHPQSPFYEILIPRSPFESELRVRREISGRQRHHAHHSTPGAFSAIRSSFDSGACGAIALDDAGWLR